MFTNLLLVLATLDDRSIVDRMASARTTVGLLSSTPSRSISVRRAAPGTRARRALILRVRRAPHRARLMQRVRACARAAPPPHARTQSDANSGKLSWSAFRGSFRQEVGGAQAGVTLDKQKHADFFHTAAVAKRVIDTNLKLDAQVTHDFADQATKLEASLLTKQGVRVSADVDKNLKVGKVDLSKEFSDLPLSRQLGDRLTVSPSIDVNERELTVELQQDVGANVRRPPPPLCAARPAASLARSRLTFRPRRRRRHDAPVATERPDPVGDRRQRRRAAEVGPRLDVQAEQWRRAPRPDRPGGGKA